MNPVNLLRDLNKVYKKRLLLYKLLDFTAYEIVADVAS